MPIFILALTGILAADLALAAPARPVRGAAAAPSSSTRPVPAKDPKGDAIDRETANVRREADRRVAERDRRLGQALKNICKGC